MMRSEMKAKARAQLGNNIFGNAWMMALVACVIFTVLTGAATSVIPGLGGLIIIGPLQYGLCRLFLKQARDGQEMDLGDIFKGFTDDFGQTILIGLLSSIFTFLWGLLLIVPGIVKGLGYSMAFYIKADYPEYDWKQCMDQSQAMMHGHKGELFMLYLSFIGWFIVGALCLGIGTLWVAPYLEATKAQFYESIKSYVVC